MTSKTSLSLIEQVIMVLVFSLATAICLNIFVYSKNVSDENKLRDEAVVQVTNASEILKYTHGDIQTAMDLCSDSPSDLVLTIESLDSGSPYLGKARVSSSTGSSELYSLEILWQEG